VPDDGLDPFENSPETVLVMLEKPGIAILSNTSCILYL
jgi:hypothetical protein